MNLLELLDDAATFQRLLEVSRAAIATNKETLGDED